MGDMRGSVVPDNDLLGDTLLSIHGKRFERFIYSRNSVRGLDFRLCRLISRLVRADHILYLFVYAGALVNRLGNGSGFYYIFRSFYLSAALTAKHSVVIERSSASITFHIFTSIIL